MVKIRKVETCAQMDEKAAQIIAAQLILNPCSVLGLATGTTPIGTYAKLVQMYRLGIISFRDVHTVNLDEYLGLPPEHPQSYRCFMNHHLFDLVDIQKANTHVPDGMAPQTARTCASYDAQIRQLGGIDLQLLGIGRNGHIGFNEPGDAFVKETHVVPLSEDTLRANARFFDSSDQVPRQALTLGIGGILGAKRILLLASGAGKARALRAALYGPVTPALPASILQLHPDVTVICDAQAVGE